MLTDCYHVCSICSVGFDFFFFKYINLVSFYEGCYHGDCLILSVGRKETFTSLRMRAG